MTLVEVMVVIAIILTLMAILGGIALAIFAQAKSEPRSSRCRR